VQELPSRRLRLFEWMETRGGSLLLVVSSWIFGVLVPALGLFVVIRGHVFAAYLVFVYAYTAILVTALAIWLLRKGKVGRLHGLFEGAFLGGALFAAPIGTLLLPAAILYISMGGIAADVRDGSSVYSALSFYALFSLGPFAWTFALIAQWVQARRQDSSRSSRLDQKWSGFLAPYLLATALCASAFRIQFALSDEIERAPVAQLDSALNHLFEWRAAVSVEDVLRPEYHRRLACDSEGAERIKDTYERWTGLSINGSD